MFLFLTCGNIAFGDARDIILSLADCLPDLWAPCWSLPALHWPNVFLCFSQLYFFRLVNCIFRLLPELGAPCYSLATLYWPCPALPRMLLLWPPAPTSQKCKVVAANKLFQYLQWHEYIQHLYLSKQKDCLSKSIEMHKSPIRVKFGKINIRQNKHFREKLG